MNTDNDTEPVVPDGVTGSVLSPDPALPPESEPEVALAGEQLAAAQALFGERLPMARSYAELLATDGVMRGLIGPREAPRLWDRHLLNCAAVAELISPSATVIDVGSGAGLPGIVLAVARPDISVILVEPLARRTAFLDEAVAGLGLNSQVTVVRGRAEEQFGLLEADVVTARAVAPLDRLAGWCLPLTSIGGRMLALKGMSAAEEIEEHGPVVARLGGGPAVIRRCGVGLIDPPTTVIEIIRERNVVPKGSKPPGRAARGGRRQRER
jgi:16S rRNA (guanine527-N7)-methyltransferase